MTLSNGAGETRHTTASGVVNFSGFDGSDGGRVSVGLPGSYRGHALGRCPNSPTSVPLNFRSWQNQEVQFRARYLDGTDDH